MILPVANRNSGHRRIAIQGQSNAMGKANRSDLTAAPLRASDPGLSAFNTGTFARVYIWNNNTGAYENLKLGTNNDSVAANTFGTEFGIAIRWMRETLHGNLYIDKQYGDGQPISYFQSGTAFFTSSVSRRAAQNAWLSSRGIRAANMGWLWIQGEANYQDTQASYQSALDTYVNSRISAGLMGPNDFRVLARMLSGTGLDGAGGEHVKLGDAGGKPTT